jgi:hypothetical protein
MPEAAEKIKSGLRVKDIPTLFSVATFERMVIERLGDAPAAPATNTAKTVPATV